MRSGMVIGICGHMGAGKGLTLQLFAAMFRRAGLNVYCNYDSTFATRRLENVPELLSCMRGALFLDEFDLIMHAREFGKDNSIKLVKWIKVIRKQGLRLFWATQNPYYLDVNVRRVTHKLINCNLVTIDGVSATRLDFYSVEQGGEAFLFTHSQYFKHNPWLYSTYDTFDARNVLSFEPGGIASRPLGPEDFMHRDKADKKSDGALLARYEQLQSKYLELERDYFNLRESFGGVSSLPVSLLAAQPLR